jgi:hypothetical protein
VKRRCELLVSDDHFCCATAWQPAVTAACILAQAQAVRLQLLGTCTGQHALWICWHCRDAKDFIFALWDESVKGLQLTLNIETAAAAAAAQAAAVTGWLSI